MGQRENQKAFLRALVYPQPAAIVPPDAIKPGFARILVQPEDFDEVLVEKLRLVLQEPKPMPTPTPIPEATSLILLASGLATLGGYLNLRRRRSHRAED